MGDLISNTPVNEHTNEKIITIIDPKKELLKNLLEIIDIKYSNLEDIIGITVSRNKLLSEDIYEKFNQLQLVSKAVGYKTGKLTSLHSNSSVKQTFPAINMLRQLLKCNGLRLKPVVEYCGYNHSTGEKIVKRNFVITLLDENNTI